jgi:hypothetical protein
MSAFFSLAAIMAFFLSWSSPANALTFLTEQEAAKTVGIEYSADDHHVISGKIVNKSPHAIRNPEVLIEYHWLWANERNPGESSPGRAAYLKLDKEIRPGESVAFTYRPQPALVDRSDGRFMPEVSPAGFEIVAPSQKAKFSSR